MKKKTLPPPPPSKRGQRRQYAQEIDATTGELLSMETRARRGRELLVLRKENDALKQERVDFLSKIDALSSQLDGLQKNDSPEVVEEHQVLQREIALHNEFLSSFKTVLEETAQTEEKTKRDLYSQGAEAAHSFLLGMLAESVKWAAAIPPKNMEIPFLDLTFRYSFAGEMFGNKEGKKRLSLRLDAFVPRPATAKSVQELFFRALCSTQDMQRLFGASESVNLFSMDIPDDHTRLLYFRRNASGKDEDLCDQYGVFICNRNVQTMTKSSLSPPSLLKHAEPVFGTARAYSVAMTTTTMFPGDCDPAVSIGVMQPSSSSASAQPQAIPVSGIVVKGIFAWDDEDFDGVRLVVIFSVPEDYKILNALSFYDLVSESNPEAEATRAATAAAAASSSDRDGEGSSNKRRRKTSSSAAAADAATSSYANIAPENLLPHHYMTEKFTNLLVRVAGEFTVMMAEGVAAAGGGTMPTV